MKKQKSGLYRASVTVGGKRIYVSGHSQREIEAEKQRVIREYETGCTCPDITWQQLVVKWYKDIKSKSGAKPGTLRNIRSKINRWVIPCVDERVLARAIRRSHLQAIIASAAEKSPSSITQIKAILSQVCTYGMELGVMHADHSNNCTDPSGYTKRHRTSIPKEDAQRIIEALHGTRIETAVMILYYTGMRAGEMLALQWSDIDFRANTISITKTMDSVTNAISTPKTQNSTRTITIHEELMDYLRPIRQTGKLSVSLYKSYNDFIIDWRALLFDLGYATLKPGYDHFVRMGNCVRCDYTPHQLRHTFATACYDAGVDPIITSRLMGHSSISITQDIYTDIIESRQQVAQRSIHDALTLHHKQSKTTKTK